MKNFHLEYWSHIFILTFHRRHLDLPPTSLSTYYLQLPFLPPTSYLQPPSLPPISNLPFYLLPPTSLLPLTSLSTSYLHFYRLPPFLPPTSYLRFYLLPPTFLSTSYLPSYLLPPFLPCEKHGKTFFPERVVWVCLGRFLNFMVTQHVYLLNYYFKLRVK